LEETDTNNFDLEDYLNHKIDYELTENKRKALKMFHHFIETINHQISI
jgi:chorismate dehydratase